MPEWLIAIFVLYLIYLYFPMKKLNTSTEKPESKATTDQAIAPEAKPKKASPARTAPKKAQAEVSKPQANEKIEQPVTTPVVVAEVKPGSAAKAPKKAKAVAAKPAVVATEMTAAERAGLTAGSIWHYLADNGTTSVAKLVRALPEDEKNIQRSIGWLAQEGKITLSIIDRVETIALKE
jgi:cytoskeletal protein RodZ